MMKEVGDYMLYKYDRLKKTAFLIGTFKQGFLKNKYIDTQVFC